MAAKIAKVFKPLFKPKRYKVFYGGRGGGKSWGLAQSAILQGAQKKLRILCTRELQNSIQESVHKLLSDTIDRLGLSPFYEVQQNVIKGRNGTEIIFEGLKNNPRKIKSTEGIDICWCEEAESITEQSWDLLEPTIRKEGSEIWVCYNPNDELDPTHQRYVIPYEDTIKRDGFYEDERIYVRKVNYWDNPWLSQELKDEIAADKKGDYKKYLHKWEGECLSNYDDSIIQPEWVAASVDAHLKLNWQPMGVKCLGFDPADTGQDNKAIAIRHGSLITFTEDWEDGDIEDATNKAFQIAYENRCNHVVYDNIGIGAGVKVGLNQRLEGQNTVVTGFNGAEGPSDPNHLYNDDQTNKDMFRNKRAQYYWLLRDRFEKTYRAVTKGAYIDPDELISISSECKYLTKLKSELSRVTRKRQNNSRILLTPKNEMIGMSPNLADSVMMCFANPATAVKPRQERYVEVISEWQ